MTGLVKCSLMAMRKEVVLVEEYNNITSLLVREMFESSIT